MAFILPIEEPWTIQPQQAVGIDWSNPITRGLLVCAVSGFDAASNKSGATSANITKEISEQGIGYRATILGSTPNVAYQSANVGTGPLTDFVLVNRHIQTGTGSVFRYLCGTYDGGSNGTGISGEHGTIGYNWGAADVGSNLANSLCSSGEQIPATGAHFLVHSRDGTNHRLYRNGVLKATVAGTSGNSSSASFVTSNLVSSGGSFSAPDTIYLAGRFNRALSDSEIRSLSQNPWQIFTP